MTGVLRRRVVIDPQGHTPGLSAIGAAAEHHVGQVARLVADRAKGVDISPRRPTRVIRRDPDLAQQPAWIDVWQPKNYVPTKIHDCGQIDGWSYESVLGVGRAVECESGVIGISGANHIELPVGTNV